MLGFLQQIAYIELMQTNADKKPTYDELVAQITRLQSENAFLKQELAQLKRLIFGQKRERFIPADSNQLDMAIATAPEPEPETQTITYTRRKQDKPLKPSRHVLPAHLPRDVVVIEPEQDTTGLKKIGETITEELEYTPPTLAQTNLYRDSPAPPYKIQIFQKL